MYQPAQGSGGAPSSTAMPAVAPASAPVSAPPGPASASAASASADQPAWNPFGDDNFSKLTAEELLNKDFGKLADGELK